MSEIEDARAERQPQPQQRRPQAHDEGAAAVASTQPASPSAASRVQAYADGRQQALSEALYRASGGAQGTAPGIRLGAERQRAVASLARFNRKAAEGASSTLPAVPSGGGAPLPSATRSLMERRLGSDLSSARVHTGSESAAAASQVGAKAFTVGSDVHFNAGQFAPGTKEGDRLLAHELTRKPEHADEGHDAPSAVSEPHEPAEQEADAVADRVADEEHGSDGPAKKNDGGAPGETAVDKKPAARISAKLEGVGFKLWRSAAPASSSGPASANPGPGGAGAPPGAAPGGATLRKKIEKEKQDIEGAGTLTAIGGKLAATAKPGVAPTRLANTVASADRARAYFEGPGARILPDAKARKEAFVDGRMAPAVEDQKAGIKKAQDEMLSKKDDELQEVDYNAAQNYAAFGKNSRTVLAPENLDSADAQATVGAVQKKGGLAKVIGLQTFWSKGMNPTLKKEWERIYGPAAYEEWSKQSKAQLKPLTVPTGIGAMDRARFAPFADPSAGFTGPLTGAMGVVDEYSDIKTWADAKAKLGLDEQYYPGGFCFLCFVPGGNVGGAVEKAAGGPGKDQKTTIGKPSLYSSLVWAEFNYIAEDRTTNTTAMEDTTNPGVPDPRGKTEVNVANLSYAELFSQPVQVIQ